MAGKLATKAQKKSFIEMIAPIVLNICKSKTRKILPSVCIAQACYESSYGTNDKAKNANAFFGIIVGNGAIKFGASWKGKVYSSDTKEVYSKNVDMEINTLDRAYASIEDSVSDYYDIIGGCSRYSNAINNSDIESTVRTIAENFSDDGTYTENILKIIDSNYLTNYDEEFEGTNKTEVKAASNIGKKNHTIGERIIVSSYYESDIDPISKAKIDTKCGVILEISSNKEARNPYMFGKNEEEIYGWCNDGDIRTGAGQAPNGTRKSIYHTVKGKDTLSSIAKKYGTTALALVSMNKSTYPNIKSNFIRVGWKLLVQR